MFVVGIFSDCRFAIKSPSRDCFPAGVQLSLPRPVPHSTGPLLRLSGGLAVTIWMYVWSPGPHSPELPGLS